MESVGPDRIGVCLVCWGRLGAGPALMAEIARAMSADPRFELFASVSRQSEAPNPLAAGRLFPIDTFAGPASLLLRTVILPAIADRLVRRLVAAHITAIVTIMPHVWGVALQRSARRAGIRTLLMVHDADPHPGERRPIFDRLVRREIAGADRVVTLSDHVANRLLALGDIAPGRVSRLFHPVFRFAQPRPAEAHAPAPFRLLFLGRILPYKGVPELLAAFALLRARGVSVTLRIAGRGPIAAAPGLLRQPGLSIEQGWIRPDAIGAILADADAVALPYLEASQSGVAAAAHGAGLPVVATPVGGLTEQVIDGVSGVLATGIGAGDIADAIVRLIETPGLYAACRAGAARLGETQSPGQFARALGDAVVATVSQPRGRTNLPENKLLIE
jgi:glycosyltransferase involved in cell wall biosynthesis